MRPYGEKRGIAIIKGRGPCYCMDCQLDRQVSLSGKGRKKRARRMAKKDIERDLKE